MEERIRRVKMRKLVGRGKESFKSKGEAVHASKEQ